MDRLSLEAQPREQKKKLKGMIDEGFVPGVVYDQKGSSEPIKIPSNEVEKLLASIQGTPLVDLSVDGKKHIALLKEVQMDHRRHIPNHLSFMSLDPKKKAIFDVEIIEKGESPAVKNSLGILIFLRNSIELRGLPGDIPSTLKADISSLGTVGDTIIATDLNIPENLEFLHDEVGEYPIATIQPFQKTLEEELEEEKEAAAEEAEALEEEEGVESEETEETAEDATPEEGQEPEESQTE